MGKEVTSMGRNVSFMGVLKAIDKKELKKHAATIHCSNTLSLLQRKISNALLYHAYKELMLKAEHEITVKQLCKLIGYQGHNHAAIKDALRGLISTIIEWNLIDDKTGAENWTASSIIASVSLQGPLCYYAYSPRMKELLHSPSIFGKIDLVIQSHFRSSYGLALYENCIRYRGLPQTKWFEIDLFKKLMGVPQGKYSVFRDFKRRVLDKAIDEVNTYSDLTIAVELIKEGRKVVKLRFKLKERAKKTPLGKPKGQKPMSPLKLKMSEAFGLSQSQIAAILKSFEETYIEEKMQLVLSSKAYQQGKIQNLPAYFLSALKNDYQVEPKYDQNIAVLVTEQKRRDNELQEIKRHVEAVWLEYAAFREQAIETHIEALSLEQYNAFMQAFFHYAEPAIKSVLHLQRNKYSRENILESPQISALLRQFALRELDFIAVVSIEEFVVQLPEEKRDAWQKLKSYDPDHPLLRVERSLLYENA